MAEHSVQRSDSFGSSSTWASVQAHMSLHGHVQHHHGDVLLLHKHY
jgi:hypothetical protein